MSRKVTPAERIAANIETAGDCWMWTGYKNPSGYGLVKTYIDGRRTSTTAHRVSYEVANGPIPDGLVIDHICHTHACVNPAHLRAVTNKQNSENKAGPTASSKTGVQGVSWHKMGRKWVARVVHNGKDHYIGLFTDINEAAAAVVAKRNELFTHNDLDRVA